MDIAGHIKVDPKANIPLVAQLTQQIAWLIASEAIAAGEQLPPIRELARALDIHMHTVRAAYHRLQADQLVTMQPKQGTIVLPYNASLVSEDHPGRPSFLFAVLMPHPASVYQPFLEGVHQASQESHWLPLVSYNYDDPRLMERALHQLIAQRVDGMIITSALMTERFFQTIHAKPATPIVFVDAPHIQENSVVPDTEDAAYLATEHLIEHGHRRIALITPPVDWENVAPCLHGFQKALAGSGQPYNPELVIEVSGFDRQDGYAGALELIRLEPRPQAVFVAADILALGVLDAFQDSGLAIPRDIALASYNDIDAASLVCPSLTTATFPAFEMGLAAVRLLHALLAGGKPSKHPIVFPTELVVRQSCGCA